VQAYFAALNNSDVEGIASLFADDSTAALSG
jgi:ketosteroid isomerase-like protein